MFKKNDLYHKGLNLMKWRLYNPHWAFMRVAEYICKKQTSNGIWWSLLKAVDKTDSCSVSVAQFSDFISFCISAWNLNIKTVLFHIKSLLHQFYTQLCYLSISCFSLMWLEACLCVYWAYIVFTDHLLSHLSSMYLQACLPK